MHTLFVENIRCSGCAATIHRTLEAIGATEIEVSPEAKTISWKNAEISAVRSTLSQIGYPETGSPEAKKLTKKARSIMSCAIGKITK